jgi:protein required for attachment to host cells
MHTPTFDTVGKAARKTWILLAHRSEAKILSQTGTQIEFLKEFDHPDGRRRNREVNSDTHGRTFSSGSPQMRHALDPQDAAVEQIADVFARQLANAVKAGRTQAQYDDLIIVAEPKFLGKLRACLDAETQKSILTSVNQNWTQFTVKELQERIRALVLENRKVA